jgi:septum site-determining protein MinD
MTKFLAFISGKGGVGKTITSINLSLALQNFGRDVVVVDLSLATPDLSLYLGVPFLPATLNNVIKGDNEIKDVVYRHPSGIKLIPASISTEDYEPDKVREAIKKLDGLYEVVLLDFAAGFDKNNLSLMKLADEAFIVTMPELPSITDALRAIKLAEENDVTVAGIILNKVREDNYELSSSNVSMMLGYPVVEKVPFDDNLRKAVHNKFPVLSAYPNSPSSVAFKKLASVLIGDKKYETNLQDKETQDILIKLGLKNE